MNHAAKANMVKLCSKTSGTVMQALDSGPHQHKIASYPMDGVKATEYMPYSNDSPFNMTGVDTYGFQQLVGAQPDNSDGTLGNAADDTAVASSVGFGYNPDRIINRWCPS